MRTFVSWRFWLTLLALGALTFAVLQLTRDDGAQAEPTPAQTGVEERTIDLIAPVFLTLADPGAAIVDGVTTARMQIRVDGFRYMGIAAGTAGENRCGKMTELAGCVVAADLLGEAVLWFTLLPAEPRNQVTLPAVTELRDDSYALLANGWLVKHAGVITRNCDEDVTSFSEFLRDWSDGSSSTFDLERQEITEVTCAGTEPIESATTTIPGVAPIETGPPAPLTTSP